MHTPGFFIVRRGEKKATLDCGCSLHLDANAVFAYCPLHATAPQLLEAVEAAREFILQRHGIVLALVQLDEVIAAAKETA